MNEFEFNIDGMTCESCAKIISRRFEKVSGIKDVIINFASSSGKVMSNFEPDVSFNSLKEALVGTDYSIRKK